MRGLEMKFNESLPAQYIQLIQELNNTEHELPEAFISQEIDQVMDKQKQRSAVIAPDREYSYEEFGEAVKAIAAFVDSKKIAKNESVAIMLHKSFEQITAAWGVVYQAKTYTPIEYDVPIHRVQDCIEMANAVLIITDAESKTRLLEGEIAKNVEIYTFAEAYEIGRKQKRVDVKVPEADDVFAIIFTSGSTGKPKGVMVTYENIKNCFAHTKQYYNVTEQTIVISVTNFCHDLSVFDVFCVMSEGGTVVVPEIDKERDPSHWANLIIAHEVNFWNSVPTLANMLVLAAENENLIMPSIKNIILGGEFVPVDVVKALKLFCPNAVIDTIGGPTETTVWNINHRVVEEDLKKSVIPYGRPIWNNQFYILNEKLELVEPGEIGVIYNSGKSVTKGYTDSSITKEKYIIHPKWNFRMYNTGDLGRYNKDGYIEIHGRADTQVKINGKRIELEEIENRLNLCDKVSHAATCVVDKNIYAFCCLKDDYVKAQVVDNWSQIFNETYDEFREENQNDQEDFSGWFNSYDHTPIPLEQMQEWRENTIDRINRIKGKRIFEIGCGTGLLLHKLAKDAEKFTGIDISDVAIENLRKEIKEAGLKNTEVYCGAADDLDAYKNERYDTIIINSVILFFDNTEYLLNVIQQCKEMLVDGGCLFIGDVRNYAMLELFNASVILYNRGEDNNEKLLERIKKRMEREKELLVAPSFFRDVTKTIPEFNRVVIHSKEAQFDNELTKFRYDVVLHKNCKNEKRKEILFEGTPSEQKIIEAIEKGNNVKITNVEHKYVVREYEQLCAVKGVSSKKLKKHLNNESIPYDYYMFAKRYGYDCCVETQEDGLMCVRIGKDVESDCSNAKIIDVHSKEYTNVPYKELTYEFIADEIMNYAKKYLPEYMVPNHIHIVEKLPQLKNGKIDRLLLKKLADENRKQIDVEVPISKNDIGEYLRALYKQMLHVEVDDTISFFQAGGHSLLAMQLLNKVKRELQVNIHLSEFMKHSSIRELESLIQSLGKSDLEQITFKAYPERRFEAFELNNMQSSYYFGRSSNVLGDVPTCMYLELLMEHLDVKKMEIALNELIMRHEMLRCIICESNKQKILEYPPKLTLIVEDYSSLSEQRIKEKVDEIFEEVSSTMIDLSAFPTFLFRTIRYKEKYWIYLGCDSTFIDGASISILLRDLYDLYEGRELKRLPISFKDYCTHIERIEQSEEYKECMQYWSSRINTLPETAILPINQEYESAKGKPSVRKEHFVSAQQWSQIKNIARKEQLSLFAIQATAYALVIARWSGKTDFTLNVPIFNRTLLDDSVMDMIGEFGSLIFLEVHLQMQDSFIENCRRIQEQFEKDMDYRMVNGARILREFSAKGRNLEFPIVLTSLTTPNGDESIYNQKLKLQRWNSQSSQVWIDSIVFDKDGGIEIAWDCYPGICNNNILDDMFTAYISCYEQFFMSQKFREESVYGFVNGKNQKKILQLNNKVVPYGIEHSLLQDGFLKYLKETPEAVACITRERSFSYQELYQMAVVVAERIQGNFGAGENRVGILMLKGWKQVVAILAILLAGGTYVPMSKEWPKSRNEKIVECAHIQTILIDDIDEKEKIEGVVYSKIQEQVPIQQSSVNSLQKRNPESAAYIIYTSGSTGEPKGVVIEHQAVINTIFTVNARNHINHTDRTFMLSEIYFDLSVYDIFGAFWCGGAVYVPSEEEKRNPECWSSVLRNNEITIWNTVPALMQMLVDITGAKEQEHTKLKNVFLSGDWIPLNLPERVRRMFGNDINIVSMGGATEASIWSNYYSIKKVNEKWKSIPYGYPMDNQQMYVLDKSGQICPVGVVGDICIGGVGLAREYLGDKKLTEERFYYHSWLQQRIYLTGDQGMYHEDGSIEFMGRLDSQVKINGFRVELGEIESAALKYPTIMIAIAVYRKEKNRIELFYKSKQHISTEQIRGYLQEKVPSYMLPGAYLEIEKVPINLNGKVDRSKLPEIKDENIFDYEKEDLQGTEKYVRELFQTVIGITELSRNSDFFRSGGDSLKAVQLLYKIKEKLKVSIQLTDIFRNPTIEGIATVIEEKRNKENEVCHEKITEYMMLSEAQRGIWFQAKSAQQKNMSHIFTLSGSFTLPANLFELEKFEAVVNQLIEMHPELRTEIYEEGYVPYQRYKENLYYQIVHKKYKEKTEHVRAILEKNVIEAAFNLDKFPLFAIETGETSDGMVVIAIGIHHIISDAYSINLLCKQLKALYWGKNIKNMEDYCYYDYVVWQNKALKNGFYKDDIAYWKHKLSKVSAMSFADKESKWGDFAGEEKSIVFKENSFEKLKEICRRNGCTLHSGVSCLVGILMHYYFGTEKVVMGIGVSGRDRAEFANTIGSFALISLLETCMEQRDNFETILSRVDKDLKEVISHSTLPFHSYLEKGELSLSKASLPTHVLIDFLDTEVDKTKDMFSEFRFSKYVLPAELVITEEYIDGAESLRIMYRKSIFDKADIEELCNIFVDIVSIVTENPKICLKTIEQKLDYQAEVK